MFLKGCLLGSMGFLWVFIGFYGGFYGFYGFLCSCWLLRLDNGIMVFYKGSYCVLRGFRGGLRRHSGGIMMDYGVFNHEIRKKKSDDLMNMWTTS